jgi:tetratricopeptide (TPR) repeat protein
LALVLDKQYERALTYFRELAHKIQTFSASAVASMDQEAKDKYDRALVMEQNGRIKAAAALYREILATQPNFLAARDRLSRCYLKMDDVQKALATFNLKNNRKWIMKMMAAGFSRWEKTWQE